MKKLLISAAFALSIAGCYNTKIVFDSVSGTPSAKVDGAFHHGGIFGLVEFSSPVNLDAACSTGVSYVHQKSSFLTGLVQTITQGIYTPQVVTVHCKSGAVSEAALNPDGNMTAMMRIR